MYFKVYLSLYFCLPELYCRLALLETFGKIFVIALYLSDLLGWFVLRYSLQAVKRYIRSTCNGRNELHLSGLRFPRKRRLLTKRGTKSNFFVTTGVPTGTPAPMWATCRSGLEGQIFHSNNKDPIKSIKTRTPLEVVGLPKMIPIAHVRYIKILTRLPGFRLKIANFSPLHIVYQLPEGN